MSLRITAAAFAAVITVVGPLGFNAVLAAPITAAEATGRPAADAAFDAGRLDVALNIYDSLLASDPKDTHALARSATILMWTQRFELSLARWNRLQALEPDAGWVKIQRANVLSSLKRFDEARAVYDEILAKDPTNHEAKMGVAAILLTSRRFEAARGEYMKAIDADPHDVDALMGQARTYAWSGAAEYARDWFLRASQADPKRPDGDVGLAYVEMGTDLPSAVKRIQSLEKRFPEDGQVKAVRRDLRKHRRPLISGGEDHSEDNFGIKRDARQGEIAIGLPGAMSLSVLGNRVDLTGEALGKRRVETLKATLDMGAGPGRLLSVWGGYDSRDGGTLKLAGSTFGGGMLTLGSGRAFWARLGGERLPLRDNVSTVDLRVVSDTGFLYAEKRLNSIFFLTGRAAAGQVKSGDGSGRVSDRVDAYASIKGRYIVARTLPVETEYFFSYTNFSREIPGLYTPSKGLSHAFSARTFGKLQKVAFALAANLSLSTTVDRFSNKRSETDIGLSFFGGMSLAVSELLSAELYGFHSTGGLQREVGYVAKGFGLRLKVRPNM